MVRIRQKHIIPEAIFSKVIYPRAQEPPGILMNKVLSRRRYSHNAKY